MKRVFDRRVVEQKKTASKKTWREMCKCERQVKQWIQTKLWVRIDDSSAILFRCLLIQLDMCTYQNDICLVCV